MLLQHLLLQFCGQSHLLLLPGPPFLHEFQETLQRRELLRIPVPDKIHVADGNLLYGNGHQVLFVPGEFLGQKAHRCLVPDVFQDGEHLGSLVENRGMDLRGGKEPAQIPGLAEGIFEQDKGFLGQIHQIHCFSSGQGMVFVDEQHQEAVFDHVAGIGLFRQMGGDTKGHIDLVLLQKGVEDGAGGFGSLDPHPGKSIQEGPVQTGEQGVAAHGHQADAQQGFPGAQGTGRLFQGFVLFLEFPGLLQEYLSGGGEDEGIVPSFPQGRSTMGFQFPDGFAESGLGEMQFFSGPGEIHVVAGSDEIADLIWSNGHGTTS